MSLLGVLKIFTSRMNDVSVSKETCLCHRQQDVSKSLLNLDQISPLHDRPKNYIYQHGVCDFSHFGGWEYRHRQKY